MQLSAANLLIASQQGQKAQPAQPQGAAKFAEALSRETGVKAADSFAPLPLKQTSTPVAAAPAAPAQNHAPAQRPGSQLDIRI